MMPILNIVAVSIMGKLYAQSLVPDMILFGILLWTISVYSFSTLIYVCNMFSIYSILLTSVWSLSMYELCYIGLIFAFICILLYQCDPYLYLRLRYIGSVSACIWGYAPSIWFFLCMYTAIQLDFCLYIWLSLHVCHCLYIWLCPSCLLSVYTWLSLYICSLPTRALPFYICIICFIFNSFHMYTCPLT